MLFAQRFRIRQELGRGGAARVVRAWDGRLERDVALKLLELEGPLAEVDRFLDEARVLAELRHPHVIELLDYGVHEGQHFLVLELLEGGTLEDHAGSLDREEATRLCLQVLAALEVGHRRDILHRDVKPGNVLLTGAGETKLSDFGLAKFDGRSVRTATGLVLGTPEYMAPELFRGKDPSPASDLWAWGCLLHHVLVGVPPVQGELATIAGVVTRGEVDLSRVHGVHLRLLSAILQPDPGARPTPAQIRSALEDLGRVAPRTCLSEASSEASSESRQVDRAAATRRMDAGLTRSLTESRGGAREGGRGVAPGGKRSWLLALPPLLLLVGWLLLGGRGGAGPSQPSKRASGGLASGLLDTWPSRTSELDVPRRIQRIHATLVEVFPDLGKDLYASYLWRVAEVPGELDSVLVGRIRDRLRSFRDQLPYHQELDRDRLDLGLVLGDPEVSFPDRWALYEALRELGHLDAYLEAWGEVPRYRVEGLLSQLVEIQDRDLDQGPDWKQAPDSVPGVPAAPGLYRVHRWPAHWPISKYVLVPNPDDPHDAERLAWMLANMDPSQHGAIYGEIDLGADPASSYGSVEFEVTLGNLVAPNLMRVRWNQYEFLYRTPRQRLRSGSWDMGGFPDHRVRISIPPGALRPGRNTVRVSTSPLPGLPHHMGFEIDGLLVELSPREGQGS